MVSSATRLVDASAAIRLAARSAQAGADRRSRLRAGGDAPMTEPERRGRWAEPAAGSASPGLEEIERVEASPPRTKPAPGYAAPVRPPAPLRKSTTVETATMLVAGRNQRPLGRHDDGGKTVRRTEILPPLAPRFATPREALTRPHLVAGEPSVSAEARDATVRRRSADRWRRARPW